MKIWKDEEELMHIIKSELFTAVVGDVMDKINYRHQFLPPQIKPLKDTMLVAGRAMTVLEGDVFDEIPEASRNSVMHQPFGLMLEALDDLKKNEVYVCTGASPSYALWGELMSTRARILGASGAVVNGYSRDTKGILEMDFPTFSYGSYGQDQGPRGKVMDFRIPIEIGKVKIKPGDIIIGDLDGVCVVPSEIEQDVLERAIQKAREEKVVRKAIEDGMGAKEAFKTYGIM